MEARQLNEGEVIEVGDVIKIQTAFGLREWGVHRVTAKTAFVRWNEVAEGKFKREIGYNGRVEPIPRREWDNQKRRAWRPE